MALVERDFDSEEISIERTEKHELRRRDTSNFVKGLVIGFGLAAVASAFLNLFQEQRERRRDMMRTESRFRSQDESGNVLGDLSNIIDESSFAFRDAIKTLDKTFEAGQSAIESVQNVIDKIREP